VSNNTQKVQRLHTLFFKIMNVWKECELIVKNDSEEFGLIDKEGRGGQPPLFAAASPLDSEKNGTEGRLICISLLSFFTLKKSFVMKSWSLVPYTITFTNSCLPTAIQMEM